MNRTLDALEGAIGGRRVRLDESLDTHTILKEKGHAEFYIETDTTDDLIKIVREARRLGFPVFILGGGSYARIPDNGIKGLVVKNNCRRFDKMNIRGAIRNSQVGVQEVIVSAESGVILNQLVRFTIEEGLEGLEYQLGLPGTLGGAICTNAKYKNKHVRDFLYSIRILGGNGEVQVYTKDLPYFLSPEAELQETEDVILSAVFKLAPEDKKILWRRGEEALGYRNNFELRI